MAAATVLEAIADIRQQIAAARNRGDLESLKQLRHRMIVARVEGAYRFELQRLMRSAGDRMALVIAATTFDNLQQQTDSLQKIIDDLERAVYWWFEERVYEQAGKAKDDAEDDLLLVLTPPQLRQITGLPIDDSGQIKPKPGRVPETLRDAKMGLREILLAVSPLLVIPGDTLQTLATPLKQLIFGDASEDKKSVGNVAQGGNLTVSAPWQQKLQLILGGLRDKLRQIENDLRRQIVLQQLIGATKQAIEATTETLLMEIQHEGMRSQGEMQRTIGEKLGRDIEIGYTLHSRFYPTTAPDHAARDGWKFFKDDRPGSNLPWSQRLIPPYRKNCLCFTVPILRSPEGEEFHAEFGLRISGGEVINVRDVGTWQTWFNQQQPWVQKKLVGEKRWFGVASRGVGSPKWEHFVKPDGSYMSPRSIVQETERAWAKRVEKVNIISDIQHRRFTEAWDRGFGKFDIDPRAEAEYRRRLDVFLRRALKQATN